MSVPVSDLPWPAPPEDATTGTPVTFGLRYEDLAQDGRMILPAAAVSLGEAVWRPLLAQEPLARAAMRAGAVPILTRLRIEGFEGPFSVNVPMSAIGRFALAHQRGEDGAVKRLLLNMWVELSAPHASTYGPRPPTGTAPSPVARVHAEHVFTRLFAGAGDRKVVSLPGPDGAPWVPPGAWPETPPAALLAPPADATPLDGGDEWLDPTPLALGLLHTDSNQHVNSLVYPRLFEEALLRRLHALGRPLVVLARALDVSFRKPAFAGQILRVGVRLFAAGGTTVAVGRFLPDGPQPLADKPHATVRLRLG